MNCPKGIVVLDCPTKWNSTYLMLMTALKFQAAFNRMAEMDKPYEAYLLRKKIMSEGWAHLDRRIGRVLNEL